MKKIYAIVLMLTCTLIFSKHSEAWGPDVLICQESPMAQHSLAYKQTGVMYAGVPTALLILQNTTLFYSSSDEGLTWNIHNVSAPSTLGPIARTKMVVTSSDSIICVIQQDNTLYFVNVESGVTGQFTTSGVQDFDVAAGSSDFIYVYVQEPNLNTIKRYGTGDGGLTWTGNTATVTTQGSRPRIYMSGTRLILNYYGPVLPDTTSSIIRAAFYNETGTGTLAAGTFQDVVTNTAAKKKQYQTVLNNGIAWFFYTEGDAQQVIKCRVSTDDGVTYQPEFIIGGDANINAWWFGASHIINVGSTGVTLTWLADSIAPSGTYDRMYYATANDLQPSTFVIPTSPFDTYNDQAAAPFSSIATPVFVNYFSGSVKSGISWTGGTGSQFNLYFDRLDLTTGINAPQENNSFSVYPSPAKEIINITGSLNLNENSEMDIISPEGKVIIQIPAQDNKVTSFTKQVDISSLKPGIYFFRINSNEGTSVRKFIVMN